MKEAQKKYFKNKVKVKLVLFTQKDIELYQYCKTINFNNVIKNYLREKMKGDMIHEKK